MQSVGSSGDQHRSVDTSDINVYRRRPSGSGGLKELFGLPFFVQCEASRSFRHLYNRVAKQLLRFLSPADRLAAVERLRKKPPQLGADSGLPFAICLVNANQPNSVCGLCKTSSCQGCYLPVTSRNIIGNMVNASMQLAVDWLDPSAYWPSFKHVLHESYTDLELRHGLRSGVTLESCLDEFTKEETLEEDEGWRCSKCKDLKRGSNRTRLWKLPDILVIYIKRFQSSGRWRDKIRTKVDFPLEGLDVAPWLDAGTARPSPGSTVYDLFGVINHIGGMTGGHYTAACRTPWSLLKDGGLEGLEAWGPGVWRITPTWLHFDDELVEAMLPSEIVSGSAYVLFYSRRKFHPSNVVNTATTS